MTPFELLLGLAIVLFIAIYFYAKYKRQGFIETIKDLISKFKK